VVLRVDDQLMTVDSMMNMNEAFSQCLDYPHVRTHTTACGHRLIQLRTHSPRVTYQRQDGQLSEILLYLRSLTVRIPFWPAHSSNSPLIHLLIGAFRSLGKATTDRQPR
jgi:hypothetical protein